MRFFIFDDFFIKVFPLEPYLKSMGFEDKGQGFPTKLFFIALSQPRLPPPI
jgi:hypothetical protein